MTTEERRVDKEGRIVLPERHREALGIEPGEKVTLTVDDGAIVVEPLISREEFVRTMTGVVNERTRDPEATDLEPTDLKSDWTDDR